jgi:esterase/lipase superfamily enzyme
VMFAASSFQYAQIAISIVAVLTGFWFVLLSLNERARPEPVSVGWKVGTAVAEIALGFTVLGVLTNWSVRTPPSAILVPRGPFGEPREPPPPAPPGEGTAAPPPPPHAPPGGGTAAPPPPPEHVPPTDSAHRSPPIPHPEPPLERAMVVKVFFATDRAASSDSSAFGTSRGAMTYGHCKVSIPYGHRTGDLERPHWYYLQFSEDPTQHVVLQQVATETGDQFRKDLDAEIRETAQKKVLLFVHGYNVGFTDAALRTGQLAFDLDLRGPGSRGVAGFYSWPSRGEKTPYAVDENNAEWTQSDLTEFLTTFLGTAPAHSVYLIAHSMGSRPTLRAIATLSSAHPELVAKLHGLILAAPDIDADTFRTQIAPVFASTGLAGTLYVSSKDKPLGFSMHFHGYPRLGDPAAGPVIVEGIETIDASDVDDGDFLGHSYFAARPALLEDIFSLMSGSTAAQRFDLAHVDIAAGRYWKFRPVAQ